MASLTQAYADAGFKRASPYDWSAISADGKSVIVSVWSDEIDRSKEPWEIDLRNHPRLDNWIRKPGNTVRKKHIRQGIDSCGGEFELVLCEAVDPQAYTRSVREARHMKERVGLISADDFDEQTGGYLMRLFAREV